MTANETLKPLATSSLTGRTDSHARGESRLRAVQMSARIAAILYLVITVAAIVAHGVVPSNLFVAGDAAATAANIAASESMLRFGGIGSEPVILLSEIVLSVLLYGLLKPVNQTLSLLAAVARLAMTTIHGLNLLNYFLVLQLVGGAGSQSVAIFSTDQLQALALLFINAHHYGFEIGIAFLSLHAVILGYLIYTSGYFPRLLGILFIVAAAGYFVDSFGQLLFAGYGTTTPASIALPIVLGEIAFPLWLLIRGVNTKGWEKRALEPA
jgi:hypothetical protein